MSTLIGLQNGFRDFLVGNDASFRSVVRDTAKADRDTLLAVYRDAYELRLIEALTDEYPGLLAMLGPSRFDDLARAFIAVHPSRHPSIRWFGRDLPQLIVATPPWRDVPGLADMARFEWTLGEAFDAADAEPLAVEALMRLPADAWHELRFEPLPSLRRLTLGSAAPQAWQQREHTTPGTLAVATEDGPVDWVIWRPTLETRFRSLQADEAVALDSLRQSRSFPEICETLAGIVGEGEAASRAAGLLRAWIEQGMIATLTH